ncbi:MAG: response regulator receiver [Myxococcales bacterium]|nr:response regulator receiver [Myxococcales bacterium]
MSERILLCIEPDSATVEDIRRELAPYALQIESIPNGDEAIEWGRSNHPAVIILSVEPRKVGYAICNKLKRSPTLREVPLVLISSEETLATFEQHKKLKSRADEYLLKPLDLADLASKIDALVGLGPKPQKTEEMDVQELDADSDIMLADDDDVAIITSSDDDETAGGAVVGDDDARLAGFSEKTNIPSDDTAATHVAPRPEEPASPFEGEKFDPETQAAFAALEAGSPEGPPAGDMVDLRNLWSDDDLPAALNWEQAAATTAVGKDSPLPEDAIRPDLEQSELDDATRVNDPDAFRTGETLGPELSPGHLGSGAYEVVDSGVEDIDVPGPEDVGIDAAHRVGDRLGIPVPRDDARTREIEARNAELEARIGSLEGERQTLRRELDEARERFTQSSTFSKEREFLGLREIINKKEKDILDLRDSMDAKEREILDYRDKVRELDRGRRDLEEKTLGFERSLVAANEKVAELALESQKSVEREKGLKARLDDAHEQLRRSHEEVDGLKKRLVQEEARARTDIDRLRAELESQVVELEEHQRAELAKTGEEHALSHASKDSAHQAELASIDAAHKAETEMLQRRLLDEQSTSGDKLASETGKLRREHEKAIASLRDEHSAQIASERQAYEALTEQKERDHRAEILGVGRRGEEELAAAEERRQRDVAEHEARRVAELEAAESRRRIELQTRDEEQHARVTELERRHLTEKTELAEKHRGDYDAALARAARAEGELAARAQELDQSYRRLSGLEADLDAARAELGDRDVRLAQNRDRMGALDVKVAEYEDQIVRAYQRIRGDEKTTEKTRRALAVALALLDERSPGATGTTGPHATMSAAKPAAEDSSDLKT